MRIGIDARFYGSLGKGLGRYTQKLIENLEEISVQSGDDYFIFLRKENYDDFKPKNKNFHKVLADYQWYTVSEQINMARVLNKYNLNLVHFPHFNVPFFYKKKFCITIHDLILLHFPTIRGTALNPFFYWIKFLAYKFIIRHAILKSEKIITVSNFTKKDILENYNINPEKIYVTCEAGERLGSNALESDEKILQKYGIIKPYILYVGNAYPHKNLEALVFAFQDIKQPYDLNLVLVGKEDYFYKKIKKIVEIKKINNVIFTDFVPDSELDTIYKNSIFYIFPSLYEGFGLPPLEAMIKETPVASSDQACMKEILGNCAFFFDATKKENIRKAIIEFSRDKELREKMSQCGKNWVKRYSWKKMAEETLKVYKNS